MYIFLLNTSLDGGNSTEISPGWFSELRPYDGCPNITNTYLLN